jgi:hypothetical protein
VNCVFRIDNSNKWYQSWLELVGGASNSRGARSEICVRCVNLYIPAGPSSRKGVETYYSALRLKGGYLIFFLDFFFLKPFGFIKSLGFYKQWILGDFLC